MSSLQIALARENSKKKANQHPPMSSIVGRPFNAVGEANNNPRRRRRNRRPNNNSKTKKNEREPLVNDGKRDALLYEKQTKEVDDQGLHSRVAETSDHHQNGKEPNRTTQEEQRQAYRMCSEQECQERQREMEVSEWETTFKTLHAKPNRRQIDPTLAITKYRRSAAAGGVTTINSRVKATSRTLEQLSATWDHLMTLITTQQLPQTKSPRKSVFRSLSRTVAFCDDRIRAMQVDLVKSRQSSKSIQIQLARYHLMELYLLHDLAVGRRDNRIQQGIADYCYYEPKFTKQALWTALSAYWEGEENDEDNDEQLLVWTILSQAAAILCQELGGARTSSAWADSQTGLVGILASAWTKARTRTAKEGSDGNSGTPVVRWALRLLAAIQVEDWRGILKALTAGNSTFHILCRICMAPALPALRFGLLQQYNVSWMKRSKLDPNEMARLLFLPSPEVAIAFCQSAGIPVEDGYLILKAAPVAPPSSLDFQRQVEDAFVFHGHLTGGRTDEDGVHLPSPELFRAVISNENNINL